MTPLARLRATAKAFHEAVRFCLHDVQLRGAETLFLTRECQPLDFNGQLISISEDAPEIQHVYMSVHFAVRPESAWPDVPSIESSLFQSHAESFAHGIRECGRNLRTAWREDGEAFKDALKYHVSGCGLRISAYWSGDNLVFSTKVQQV